MELRKLTDGYWHLSFSTTNIEGYLSWMVHHDHSVKLEKILNWDTIWAWQFHRKIREQFYIRAVTSKIFPTVEQLYRVLTLENKACVNSLLGFIGALSTTILPAGTDKVYDKWKSLLTPACASMTKKELMKVWKWTDGHRSEAYTKRLLAAVYPASFYMLVMSQVCKEHLNEWRSVFERRMKT